MIVAPLKRSPDDENEVWNLAEFSDADANRVIPVAQFEASVAAAIVDAVAGVVRRAHASPAATRPDANGIVRAQVFEEGHVYMLAAPFAGYNTDRYLMDFYDVKARDLCSRMHLHTGPRYVRIMTGPDTEVRISSLSPLHVVEVPGVTPFIPEGFEDMMTDGEDQEPRTRYNLVVPQNSWVDMQVPRRVSHQFNAIGQNAVVDSVHPQESEEVQWERMSNYKMMAQTIFLAGAQPSAASCVSAIPIKDE